jgi:asparagine synthase (glutamine-hydrolysing)
MLQNLEHRGPDSGYLFLDPQILLGLRRLAIINVSEGHQPVFNPSKEIVSVFNGEIYNYLELREELRSLGHVIREGSDAEIIPAAYLQWGEDFVSHFNGDFAIAVWNKKTSELLLARDRVGVKPLYYGYTKQGDLIFASEAKAIFAHPEVHRQLNRETLSQIFTIWTPVDGASPFEGLQQVEAGSMVRFRPGKKPQKIQYWNIPYSQGGDSKFKTFEQSKDAFKEAFAQAVKLRLQADVPVGTYTSGGIDSAVIAMVTYRELKHKDTRTFSVTFDDPLFDEEKYQRLVVDSLGLEYNPVKISNSDIYENFIDTVYSAESPLFRTAPVPMRLLSKAVRAKGIKVILTGEGSDEVNWGYDIYRETKVRRFWSRSPESKARPQLFKRMYHYLPQFQNPRFFNLSVDFFKAGMQDLKNPFYSHLPRFSNSLAVHTFFSDDMKQAVQKRNPLNSLLESLPEDFSKRSSLEQCQYLEMKTLLNGYLLSAQGDRMLSANSVEGRFPYLDHNLIELVTTIPARHKLSGLKDKHVLRESYKDQLPPEIISRSKHAYRAPEMQAFANDTRGYVRELLSPAFTQEVGVFDSNLVSSLFDKLTSQSSQKAFTTRDNLAFVEILSTHVLYHSMIKAPAWTSQPLNMEVTIVR